MSSRSASLRIPVVIFGCVALSIAVTRCSPLSPSLSKLRQAATTPTAPSPLDPIAHQVQADTKTSPLLNIPAMVLEYESYQLETSTLPTTQRVTLSADSFKDEFQFFKQNRSVSLHFGGAAPDECKGYLGLSLSDSMISTYELNPVTTDCTLAKDGTWLFKINAAVPQDIWDRIENSLQSITIFVSNNPQMTVVAHSAPNTCGKTGISQTQPRL